MSTTDSPASTPAGAPPHPLSKGLAIAALCVGIIAFLTGLVPVLGLLLGAAAAVLGVLTIRAVKAGRGSGGWMGVVGLVLGAVAALTNVVVLLAAVGLAAGGGEGTASATAEPSASASAEASPSTEAPTPAEKTPAPESPSGTSTPEPAPSEAAAPSPSSGVGVPVTTEDGAQYTLTNFACGIPQVGSELLNSRAQGEYCQADLTLTNTGKKSVSFSASDVKAFAGDVEYEVDAGASLYADEGNAFLEDVNPGNTLQSKVFFDVPTGTRLERMEVGGGLFSDGESIQLP